MQFWRSVPGFITAAAGFLTAMTGLIAVLNTTGLISSGEEQAPAPAAVVTNVSGQWQASVTYGWGATHAEQFAFDVDGDRLTGTATFLTVPRGLSEGTVDGNSVTFVVPLQELSGDTTRNYELRYTGTLVNGGMHFRVEDSRGNPDIQFAASRQLP